MATTSPPAPAWRLEWLTPARCHIIFGLFVVIVLVGNLLYMHHTPIDLGGDEAQYWDWSRNLDLSYYSKGPAVAYIIRASCAIFGDTMPAVRYPAVVIHLATLGVVYLVTRKLFGSDRLALGTVLLFGLVPLVIAGSFLMTIDPPMFLCWGLATYFAAWAVFDRKPWAWVLVGIAIGLGFLAKYIALLWFIGPFVFLVMQRERRMLAGAAAALGIALLFALPVLIWNARNDWVSFRHVAQQTQATSVAVYPLGPLEVLAGQALVLGPAMTWIMGAAILHATRSGDARQRFLLWMGLPMLIITVAWGFKSKIQLNWPAPAYFSLLILCGHFLGIRLQSMQTWKPWRGWFWAAVVTGVIAMPLIRETSPLLPLFERIAKTINPESTDVDPLARLRGWEELGEFLSTERTALGDDCLILADDYQQTAEAAFYTKGQPRTYCVGSYYGKRMSQYDLWPDRRLDNPGLVGKNALFVGKGGGIPPAVREAFSRVERLPFLEIRVNGVLVRRFTIWRCYNFKGMTRASQPAEY